MAEMDVYEIRIKNPDQRFDQVYSSAHAADSAAVGRAWALAGAGETIEIWKGLSCIFLGTKLSEEGH